MKIMFLSDVHGSIKYATQALEIFQKEGYDKLVLLGDLMYHGPRNPLPDEYDTMEVSKLLNLYKDKIVAIRGNCDSEVDQMLLDFPIMSDFAEIVLDKYKIFATHGHIYNSENMPPLNKGDIFIHGHFHVPMAENLKGIYYLNPGSISLPKNNSKHSYGCLENNVYTVKALDGTTVTSIAISVNSIK